MGLSSHGRGSLSFCPKLVQALLVDLLNLMQDYKAPRDENWFIEPALAGWSRRR